jgi:hypothetical protein
MKLAPLFLPFFVAGTLSAIHFLPSAGSVAQSAVNMTLPSFSDEWELKHTPPAEKELQALAKDTEFSKATCLMPRSGEYDAEGYRAMDRIDLSVVLSGSDINNSIHRPERCMPAQGHTILSTNNRALQLDNGRTMSTKRLISVQRLPLNAEQTEFMELKCVTYYFFVGHDHISSDHIERTLLDMKDRIVKGMDQRWAYVSCTTWFGKLPWLKNEITEAEADEKIASFLKDFAEKQINWQQVKP